MQDKLTGAVLATIRSRRDSREGKPKEAQANLVRAGGPVRLRQAEFADFESVAALGQRLGQGADSKENWKRLWVENPAVQSGLATSKIGWVLESGDSVVGFFGSIPLLCEFEGKTLAAAATCRFAVDPEFRSSAHLLVSSFLRQKDVDLFLNTTATPAAGKIMAAMKAAPLPQADYGTVLYWVINPGRFVSAVFRKLEARPVLTKVGAFLGSFALSAETQLRGRRPGSATAGYDISDGSLDEVPADFDDFCQAECKSRSRLTGKRNAVTLRWHFAFPGSKKECRVWICRREDKIAGYAITRQEFDSAMGLRRTTVPDLLAAEDNPQVVRALIAAAYATAKRSDSHVLEVMGFPAHIKQILMESNPYTRQYPSNPYFYKARDRALHERLSNSDVWYACPFDGDATLWP